MVTVGMQYLQQWTIFGQHMNVAIVQSGIVTVEFFQIRHLQREIEGEIGSIRESIQIAGKCIMFGILDIQFLDIFGIVLEELLVFPNGKALQIVHLGMDIAILLRPHTIDDEEAKVFTNLDQI